jgi:hypothetical protein
MNLKTFKTPKIIQDLEDDPDGIFYEKMFLIEQAISTVDTIFSEYIKLRTSPEWTTSVKPALLNWISEVKT